MHKVLLRKAGLPTSARAGADRQSSPWPSGGRLSASRYGGSLATRTHCLRKRPVKARQAIFLMRRGRRSHVLASAQLVARGAWGACLLSASLICLSASDAASRNQACGLRGGRSVALRIASCVVEASHQSPLPLRRASRNYVHDLTWWRPLIFCRRTSTGPRGVMGSRSRSDCGLHCRLPLRGA